MEIRKNSRQIPSDMSYTANKKYSDLLYGYLQANSHWDEGASFRYLLKSEVNFTKIAEELDTTRQTVSRKMKSLMEAGLVVYDDLNRMYILDSLEKNLATLLPCDTVGVLCNTLKERSLSLLVYLLNTFIQHGEKSCEINIDIMKQYLGLSLSDRGKNNKIVTDILKILQKLGFINYHITKIESNGSWKTVYILDSVDNYVYFN